MSERRAPLLRPRIWQVALVLNAFFPPAGYAYVGAWRTAWVFAALVCVAAVAAVEATLAFPPGLYRLGVPGVIVLALVLAVGLGVHAAWIADSAPPRGGSRLRNGVVYGLTNVALLTVVQVFYGWWPHAFYTFSGSSMEPTLKDGDIIAVLGAHSVCAHPALRPGDVVLYQRPGRKDPLMGRVVAGPGQTVAVRGGGVFVDGRPLRRDGVAELPTEFGRPTLIVRETLPDGRAYRTLDVGPRQSGDDMPVRQVPEAAWFVLSDNRDLGADSRTEGPVPARALCGVALSIISSEDRSHVGARP